MSKQRNHRRRSQIRMRISRSLTIILIRKKLGKDSLGRQEHNTRNRRESMGRLQNALSLGIQEDETALSPQQKKEERTPNNLGMGLPNRIPQGERGNVLSVPETDLPSHVCPDDSHAEEDGCHGGSVAPVEEEVWYEARIDCLVEHRCPDVGVGLDWSFDCVGDG